MAKDKKAKKAKAKQKTGAEATDGADAPEKKGKLALLGGVLKPVLAGGAAFLTVYLMPQNDPPPVHQDEKPAKVKDAHNDIGIPDDLITMEIPEITLSVQGKRSRIIKLGLALEVRESAYDTLDTYNPKLRDTFLSYLRATDVKDLEDPVFFAELRKHLLRRARLILGPDIVYNVLITDFLVR